MSGPVSRPAGAAARAATSRPPSMPIHEQLAAAREIVRREAVALWELSNRMGESVTAAIGLLAARQGTHAGSVIVTGMGKAGLVGQKIAATLASTGAAAHFLHPAEACHGDLGRVHPRDTVLMLSQSGETAEVTGLLPSLRDLGVPIVAVTASSTSTLGRAADVVIELGQLEEACSLGLAPSTSTTAMLALGDALALVLSATRGFSAEDFARNHPGGSLGRRLSRVEDCMRPLDQCRVAPATRTAREVIVGCGRPGRRTGAVMLTAGDGRLVGLFTDSDLARLLERGGDSAGGVDAALDEPIERLMATAPATIPVGARMSDAVAMLARRKFSELPVVDPAGVPVGMIDVTDVVGWRAEKPADQPRPTIRVFPGEGVFAAG